MTILIIIKKVIDLVVILHQLLTMVINLMGF